MNNSIMYTITAKSKYGLNPVEWLEFIDGEWHNNPQFEFEYYKTRKEAELELPKAIEKTKEFEGDWIVKIVKIKNT